MRELGRNGLSRGKQHHRSIPAKDGTRSFDLHDLDFISPTRTWPE